MSKGGRGSEEPREEMGQIALGLQAAVRALALTPSERGQFGTEE